GLDSTISSPVSQHFLPLSSPSSKLNLNGGGSSVHQQSPYTNHVNQSDSAAEELQIPSRLPSSFNHHHQPRGRVRSLGTTSLFNELSTTQEEEDCHTDFNNRPLTKRATTFDLLRSSTHHHQDPLLTSSIGQSSITSNHNPNSSDRTSPSLRTVISKSSLKIFNKLPGLKS
ncbi:hypothetical protein PSTG_19656, partial [Puccinia striiformis f. sp. tritici PST-78]